jgi:hypothetical protein
MVCCNNVFFAFDCERMLCPEGGAIFWKILGAKKEEITGEDSMKMISTFSTLQGI